MTAPRTDQTIRRSPHDAKNPYFMMNRSTAQDDKLSWEARGVLTYLLSKPDDWKTRVADLQQKCGRDKVKKILRELETAGYLEVERLQHADSGLFAVNNYIVHETPFTENPSTVKPSTVNTSLTYTEDTEKNIAPPEETASDAPAKARKIASRTEQFKVIAAKSFGLPNTDTLDKNTVVRINILAKWLRDNAPDATAATLVEFYGWYDATVKAARPRDVSKFAEHFQQWKQGEKLLPAFDPNPFAGLRFG